MSKTVLLVEDFENDVILMRRFWKKEHVPEQLQVVTDGQAALDYLSGREPFSNRETHPLPCLILLDLKLPRVMGLDVLAWIRAQPALATTPVIVFSTSGLGNDVDQAYSRGANAFLVKPSDVTQLAEIVRLVREFWLGINHFPRHTVPVAKPAIATFAPPPLSSPPPCP